MSNKKSSESWEDNQNDKLGQAFNETKTNENENLPLFTISDVCVC